MDATGNKDNMESGKAVATSPAPTISGNRMFKLRDMYDFQTIVAILACLLGLLACILGD